MRAADSRDFLAGDYGRPEARPKTSDRRYRLAI
jgi:hypothetical protein